MPGGRNNPGNPFVSKSSGRGPARPADRSQMEIEPVPGDSGPGIVDATKPAGQFSDRIKYDEYGGVDKSTMRPKQKIQRT